MPGAHRDTDPRFPSCGAPTVASNHGVYVNGLLWAVNGDENKHKEGKLQAIVGHTVKISGIDVIVAIGDTAGGDEAGHSAPSTNPFGHSNDVFAYGP